MRSHSGRAPIGNTRAIAVLKAGVTVHARKLFLGRRASPIFRATYRLDSSSGTPERNVSWHCEKSTGALDERLNVRLLHVGSCEYQRTPEPNQRLDTCTAWQSPAPNDLLVSCKRLLNRSFAMFGYLRTV